MRLLNVIGVRNGVSYRSKVLIVIYGKFEMEGIVSLRSHMTELFLRACGRKFLHLTFIYISLDCSHGPTTYTTRHSKNLCKIFEAEFDALTWRFTIIDMYIICYTFFKRNLPGPKFRKQIIKKFLLQNFELKVSREPQIMNPGYLVSDFNRFPIQAQIFQRKNDCLNLLLQVIYFLSK